MDVVVGVMIMNCFLSPVLVAIAAWLGYLYSREMVKTKTQAGQIAAIGKSAVLSVRDLWFEEIKRPDYYSESDVEAKLIYPMMRFLGYAAEEIKMRVSVNVQMGRSQVMGIADWVISKGPIKFLVIEAKEQGQALNQAVQDQARSYCYGMNIPMYLITNGTDIKVYERGLNEDVCVFSSRVDQLREQWAMLEARIGRIK